MSVEINNANLNPPKPSDGKASPSGSATQPQSGSDGHKPTTPAADSVEISSGVHKLHETTQRLAAEDSFDAERVESIRSAIEQGHYPIDAERLASKFMELETQLNQ